MSGEETKIDKNMIEKLIDPLIHIIRNSIDHGIEPEEVRIKKNKNPVGYIHLSAFYKGDNVIIQIEDDGAGINIKKVSEIALKKNLITKEMLEKMSREEIMLLIFQPGFSTAEKVTELSGRGVGMDVVKKTIEELNGTISIKSEEDVGTVISLFLPLTLAIMQILLIKVLNYTLAIPLYLIKETVFCQKSDIYELSDKLVFNLRGEIVPIIILNDILNIPKSPLMNVADNNDSSIPIVIITVNEKNFGFIVDKLEGKQEIVLKNFGTLLNRVPFVSGATIMGDGSVVLILDIIAIIRESNKYKFVKVTEKIKEEPKTSLIKKKVLVVDDAMAIRSYLKKQLLEFGFEVDEAENGKVALLKSKDKKYDLFTIDFLMPEMDGYELISLLRNTDNYKKTPIIAISSKGENVDKIKGFELGVDEYIVKPIDKEIFTGIIKKYFF
ncbi:MAG TPA: response regulator [bacterium]|nr:response regulator [bacterium]HOL48451.1 response regulator [bacterium]HPQ19146.1 response regulator [bacterium]